MSGPKPSLPQSPHFERIREMLEKRWSPRKVVQVLQREGIPDEEIPSVRTLQRWRKKNLPEHQALPPSLIEEKTQSLELKVDLLAAYQEMEPLLRERVKRGDEAEKTMMGGLPSDTTTRAAHTWSETAEKLKRLMQDLGILPSQPTAEQNFTQNILMVKSEEELRKLLELARRAKEQGT